MTYCCLFSIISAQNTTRKDLIPAYNDSSVSVNPISEVQDADSCTMFMPEKIILKNYEKKLQDARESFFIVNNTPWHISRLNILFRYTDMDDSVMHERTVMVECDLPSGAERQASIKTFDTQHQLYYYLSKQPRRESRPFKVYVKILRYDIVAD